MKVFRKLLPGLIVLVVIGLAAKGGLALLHDRSWIPPRSTGATRGLAILFLCCDVAVGTTMVSLLLCRESFPPKKLEWLFPLRGRWLWYTLFGLSVAAYAGLAPAFLFFLASLRH